MENAYQTNSIPGYDITKDICICHHSTAAMLCRYLVAIDLLEFGWEQIEILWLPQLNDADSMNMDKLII